MLDAPYIMRDETCARNRRRRARLPHRRAHHHLAQPELDRGGGAPHHPDRSGAAEVHLLGEVHRPAAVLGDGRGNEQRRLGDIARAHQAVDLRRRDAGVGQCVGGEPGPLLHGERRRAGELALRGALGDPDDARLPEGRSRRASYVGRAQRFAESVRTAATPRSTHLRSRRVVPTPAGSTRSPPPSSGHASPRGDVGTAGEPVGVRGRPARARRPDRSRRSPLPFDPEGEAAEHALLADALLTREQLADPVGELCVVRHGPRVPKPRARADRPTARRRSPVPSAWRARAGRHRPRRRPPPRRRPRGRAARPPARCRARGRGC